MPGVLQKANGFVPSESENAANICAPTSLDQGCIIYPLAFHYFR